MEVWDIAKAFDMSIKEFCAVFGYNRQTLLLGGCRRPDRREAGMKRLRNKSMEMYEHDIREAERKRLARSWAIQELEERLMTARETK